MDTQNDPQYPHGKTIIKKYSSWKHGQHKSSVLQSVPGHKTQFIGKIYFEKIGEEKNYVAKSSDDKEVFGVSKREYELEKWFAQEGHRLAVEKLEAEKAQVQVQAVEPSHEQPRDMQTEELMQRAEEGLKYVEHEDDEMQEVIKRYQKKAIELNEIRARGKDKGKGINR